MVDEWNVDGDWRAEQSSAIDVLVVEDDSSVSRAIARMLPQDFKIHRAPTKSLALRALRNTSCVYRLVLIDVSLGRERTAGLEVLDVAAQARGLVRALVTGSKDPKVTNRAVARGAYLIGKPFDKEHLAPLIHGARELADPLRASIDRSALDSALEGNHLEVVRLLAAGRTRDEIALDLNISQDTLRTHVNEILSGAEKTKFKRVTIRLLREAIAQLIRQ